MSEAAVMTAHLNGWFLASGADPEPAREATCILRGGRAPYAYECSSQTHTLLWPVVQATNSVLAITRCHEWRYESIVHSQRAKYRHDQK